MTLYSLIMIFFIPMKNKKKFFPLYMNSLLLLIYENTNTVKEVGEHLLMMFIIKEGGFETKNFLFV